MTHVCFANNYLYARGGCERVMFDEAALLETRGWTVSFFSRRFAGNRPCPQAEHFPDGVDFDQLGLLGKLRQAPRIVYNRETRARCGRFLDATRPDVLHAHNIYGGLTSAALDAAAQRGIPAVMTLHDYKLICPSYLALDHGRPCEACQGGRFYHCLRARCHKGSLAASAIYCLEAYLTRVRRAYDTARVLICPSRFLHGRMLANGFDAERLYYLPNAIDAARITPSYTPGSYALYAGRLSHEKGVLTLLRAMREANAVPLRIAGDGPLRAEVEAYVAAHGLGDRVVVLGHQSGEALARLYGKAAFCVVPSEWYENAPMAVLEPFAYGKPVVGAAIGGIPEMIEDERTGLLVPSGNVEALSAAMARLWCDRAACEAMGLAARTLALNRFSPDRHADGLIALYRRVLGTRVVTA